MKIFLIIHGALLFCLFGRIARKDALLYRIDAISVWLAAALSFPRAFCRPALWGGSLLTAVSLCLLLLLTLAALKEKGGKILMGGGDVKLLFALLLHINHRHLPLFLGILGFYILFLRFTWPHPSRLPLGPALCGAGACLLLGELTAALG